MNSTYIPPSYLSFEQFFEKISKTLEIENTSPTLLVLKDQQPLIANIDCYCVTHINDENIAKLETILSDPLAQHTITITLEIAEFKFSEDKIEIKNKKLKFLEFEDDNYLFNNLNSDILTFSMQQKKWARSELKTMINQIKIQNCMRNAICSKKVLSFLYSTKEYELPPQLWANSHYWLSLLRTRNHVRIPLKYINDSSNIIENDIIINDRISNDSKDSSQITGRILFKEEDVISLCKITEKTILESSLKTQLHDEVINVYVQKILTGEIKLRASNRLFLYIASYHQMEITTERGAVRKVAESNKDDFISFILRKAEELGFSIVEPQNTKDFDEEKSVSRLDAEAIATLVKSLHKQGR